MPVRTTEPSDLHVLLCFRFDHRAEPSAIASFKERLINSETSVHSVEVAGTFDFICEERFPDLLAYHRLHTQLAADIAELTEGFEACFVWKRFIRDDEKHVEALWVCGRDGKRRVPVDKIRAIHADGDYVRLELDAEELLHDATMNGLEAALDETQFVRLHRCLIVRLDRIASLVHQGHGWAARLVDGTEQRIAKSRFARVMKVIRDSSATPKVHSATNDSGHRKPNANERPVIDMDQYKEEKPLPGQQCQ